LFYVQNSYSVNQKPISLISVNIYPLPNALHSPKHGTIFFGSRYGAAATSAGLKKYNSLILFYPSLYPQQPLHTARKQRKNFSPRGYYGHLKENLAPRKREGSQACPIHLTLQREHWGM
jgi:hypothetical protein